MKVGAYMQLPRPIPQDYCLQGLLLGAEILYARKIGGVIEWKREKLGNSHGKKVHGVKNAKMRRAI